MERSAVAPPSPPRISVVMATFDRSHVIGYAIRALQAQTLRDWELIVVGDACTDDTAAVVAGFADPRIRFLNLERNCGEQSGPNNAGVALARGAFLAFLNHDDLWLPQHLETTLAALEREQADLVFTLGLVANRGGARMALTGATTRRGRYHTSLVAPASLWLMRRELVERVGPWYSAFALRVAPSQDWLHRAARSGARVHALAEVTALLITSGDVPGSYRERRDDVHARFEARLREPGFIRHELLQLLLTWEDARLYDRGGRLLLEGLLAFARRALRRLGVFPGQPVLLARHWRRGHLIRRLRRVRGLPEV
jgi:glycosyltransferase involved in cell wall biosynthesis